MIQQLDFFKAPTPMIEQPSFIGADNTLILFPPSPEPTGAEAAERKAARLREIKDREAARAAASSAYQSTRAAARCGMDLAAIAENACSGLRNFA